MLDAAEHFEKMSYRNRYYIATAHGKQCLSIPLTNGRNQRVPMKEVRIAYAEDWQQQHWRTIFSAYNRSPYFEYYKDSLLEIFQQKFDRLIDFNLATIHWLKQKLNVAFEEKLVDEYVLNFENAIDLRKIKPKDNILFSSRPYYQVFEERTGFLENLSMLDLLFNEGRNAVKYLK